MIIAFKTTNIDEILSSILEKMDYETGCLTNKGLDGIMDEPRLSKIYKRYKDSSSIGGQEIQQVLSQIKMPKKASLLQRQNLQKRPKRLPKIVKTLA